MRTLSLIMALVVTLFAVGPSTLLPVDACLSERGVSACCASACSSAALDMEHADGPCEEEGAPCACNPFMTCASCVGAPIATGPSMGAPLSVAFALQVMETVPAPMSVCLVPVLQPPRA